MLGRGEIEPGSLVHTVCACVRKRVYRFCVKKVEKKSNVALSACIWLAKASFCSAFSAFLCSSKLTMFSFLEDYREISGFLGFLAHSQTVCTRLYFSPSQHKRKIESLGTRLARPYAGKDPWKKNSKKIAVILYSYPSLSTSVAVFEVTWGKLTKLMFAILYIPPTLHWV